MENFNDNLVLPDTNANKYIKIGVIILIITFGILGGWSSYAKMATGVPLGGQVVIESNDQVVQHLEGGIVKKIYIEDGDYVNKGDILIQFNDTQSRSALASLEANYYETLAMENRLIAEDQTADEIEFSKELDKLDEAKKSKLVNAQLEIFNNNKSTFEKEKKMASQKVQSLNSQIGSLKNTIESLNNLLVSYKTEAQEQEELYKQRLIDKVKLRDVKRKIESLESDISKNEAEIENANIQISEVKTELSLKQESFYRQVKNKLREAQTSIADMKGRMINIQDILSRTALKAPVSGTVLDLNVHTVGAVVSPGKPILQIVPNDSKLIIKAQLSPEYIDYAKVGLKANMMFPAFQLKGRFINNIEGEVIFVAPDSSTDSNGNSFYTINLVVDKVGEQTLKDENLSLLAGMPASIVIKIGTQTALEYLLRPLTVMLDRAFLEE